MSEVVSSWPCLIDLCSQWPLISPQNPPVQCSLIRSRPIYQGIIDPTETETHQIFFCISVTAKDLKSCLPLLEME